MRLAAIDLGSNTVHLLVADVGPGGAPWQVVDSDQRVTRLGEGLAASGRLGQAPTERTTAAVVEYVARARAAGAERVAIVATSAVREASNRADFVVRLERAAGERVRVVTGEEEAALTLAGVLHGLGQPLDGTTLMFDIGGGSTEYVLVRRGGRWRRSAFASGSSTSPSAIRSRRGWTGRGTGRSTTRSPAGCARELPTSDQGGRAPAGSSARPVR